MSNVVFHGVPGKPIVEKPLVVRQISGKNYYWNYSKNKWVRLTSRCPYL